MSNQGPLSLEKKKHFLVIIMQSKFAHFGVQWYCLYYDNTLE